MTLRRGPLAAILSFALAALPAAVSACASCYGDPNSGLTKGAKAAVIFMIALITGILFAIARTARVWKKRADALALSSDRA